MGHQRPKSGMVFRIIACSLAMAVAGAAAVVAQSKREFSVAARKYSYTVSGSANGEIRVQQNDLVQIHFRAEDIPHSFTIEDDHYRIMKRAEPGRPPVSFDFRADKPGRFRFFCSLTIDERCREMEGTLVVDPR